VQSFGQIIGILLDVVGPVFIIAAVGYGWARSGKTFDSFFVALVVNGISTPCLVLDTFTRAGLAPAALTEMALASALCLSLAAVSGWALVRGMGLPVRTYLPSLIWTNGGNMGLPLCLFAFGERGLGLAIACFAVSSVSNYTFGQALAAGGLGFRQVLKMPMMWALALTFVLLNWDIQLPVSVGRAVNLLGAITVPLMLLSLGYALASLNVASFGRNSFFAAVRLLGGFAIGWLVAWGLELEGVARGVLIIQSAMPAAVLNYLFAARYNNDPQEVAGVVVISTLMSVVALPLFLLSVL
jgi:predicted permease